MSTMIFKEEEIIQLCKVDTELITMALSISKKLGILAIKDAINNYKSILMANKSSIVFNMDLDYRTYIVNLLKLSTESASEENKAIIFSEIVVPS